MIQIQIKHRHIAALHVHYFLIILQLINAKSGEKSGKNSPLFTHVNWNTLHSLYEFHRGLALDIMRINSEGLDHAKRAIKTMKWENAMSKVDENTGCSQINKCCVVVILRWFGIPIALLQTFQSCLYFTWTTGNALVCFSFIQQRR